MSGGYRSVIMDVEVDIQVGSYKLIKNMLSVLEIHYTQKGIEIKIEFQSFYHLNMHVFYILKTNLNIRLHLP